MLRRLIAIACLSILTSCGGGGGGGDSNPATSPSSTGTKPPTVPVSTSPALTFAPSVLRANVQPGMSATVSLQASVVDPQTFATAGGGVAPVYIYIVDSQQVLSKDFGLANLTPTLFSTTFHTAANLSVGKHAGTLQVQICKDVQCNAQYAGSPVDLPYEIVVNNYPIMSRLENSPQATMHVGGSAADVSVFVNTEAQDWSARSDVSWLKVSAEKRRGSGRLSVSFVSSGLAPGNYSGNIIVSGTDSQTNVLPFSLTILPKQVDASVPTSVPVPTQAPTPVPPTPPASGPNSVTPPIAPPAEIRITSGIPQFTAVNGEPIAGQALSFVLAYQPLAQWSASTTASWLLGSPLTGTTQGSIMLRPDPSIAKLASGNYATDLLLTSSGGLSRKVSVGLTLLPARLTASESSILLGGENGRDFSVKTLNISLNTGSNAFPWVLSGLPDWVTTTTSSGTVSQKGATLSFGLNLAKLPVGSSSAAATITATVNGDTVSLPITINANRDQQKLLASEWGVGLSSTPTGDVTSRSIKISDNFAANTEWTASSDSAWLSVTPSGTTGKNSDLVMKADPSKLVDGSLSYASIAVKTNTAGVEPALIKVAIWKDSAGAVAMAKLPINYSTIIADKIRPYIYAHNGGTSIDVYHAFTATKIFTISNVAANVAGMAVSPDGSRLFVLDSTNPALAVVDLSNMKLSATWKTMNANSETMPLLAMRSNGVDFVLLGNGMALRDGMSLGKTALNAGYYGQAGSMSATADGRAVFIQDSGISPASSAGYDINYSALADGMLMIKPRANSYDRWGVSSESNGQDIAVSFDGSRVYRASGYPYRCSLADPFTLEKMGALSGGDAYPNNVEVSNDGRVICGIDGYGSIADFWVHTANGAQISSHKIGTGGSLKPRQLVVTPDSLIVVTQTTAPTLAFVAIGL